MLNVVQKSVGFWDAAKLLKMERETGLEPATSSLGSWHSTTELLPQPLHISYLPLLKGLSRFRGQSIPSTKSRQSMGSDRKMDSKTDSKSSARKSPCGPFQNDFPSYTVPSHDNITISQRCMLRTWIPPVVGAQLLLRDRSRLETLAAPAALTWPQKRANL
jgi:hypothetical protein